MQRYILEQNFARFRKLLAEETNEARQRTLRSLGKAPVTFNLDSRGLAFLGAPSAYSTKD
jgi:hypothetical protein